MTIPGVDVSSNNQHPIDWAAVAGSGVGFVIVKATEGTRYVNPDFAADWSGAQAAGLVRLAYHFARPNLNTPEAEATHFLAAVQTQLAPGDGLALDLEAGDGNLHDWTLAWLQTVEAAVGFKPLLYTGAWFAVPHGLTGSADLGQYGLWLAAYQATMPAPLPGWDFIAIWQNGDKGNVAGIDGPVDTDFFNGTDIERLRAYGKPVPPPLVWDEAARLAFIEAVAAGVDVSTLQTTLAGYGG